MLQPKDKAARNSGLPRTTGCPRIVQKLDWFKRVRVLLPVNCQCLSLPTTDAYRKKPMFNGLRLCAKYSYTHHVVWRSSEGTSSSVNHGIQSFSAKCFPFCSSSLHVNTPFRNTVVKCAIVCHFVWIPPHRGACVHAAEVACTMSNTLSDVAFFILVVPDICRTNLAASLWVQQHCTSSVLSRV